MVGNSRVEESPASLKDLGTRTQTVGAGESDYLWPALRNLPH